MRESFVVEMSLFLKIWLQELANWLWNFFVLSLYIRFLLPIRECGGFGLSPIIIVCS